MPLLRGHDLAVGRPGTGVVATGLAPLLVAGACLAVAGPNGAGKSTLALTLGGLLPPAGGMVEASSDLSRGLGSQPHAWRARELFTRVGTVFQDPEHQFLTAGVRAELEHGPRLAGASAVESVARADELMARLRLEHLARAHPFTLSGGEKRRLSVATALATRPQVLVLDEPTFGQDARTWSEVVGIVAGLLEDGAAVLLVTHDADVADALADHRLDLGFVAGETV